MKLLVISADGLRKNQSNFKLIKNYNQTVISFIIKNFLNQQNSHLDSINLMRLAYAYSSN
jgi:hypothetical protein